MKLESVQPLEVRLRLHGVGDGKLQGQGNRERNLYGRRIDAPATKTSLDKGTQRKTTENELPSLTQCTA